WRDDHADVLKRVRQDSLILYDINLEHCKGPGGGSVLWRPTSGLSSAVDKLYITSDAGSSTFHKVLSTTNAEHRARNHLAFSAALVAQLEIASELTDDAVWAALTEDGKTARQLARNVYLACRDGAQPVREYDDSDAAHGRMPQDEGAVGVWFFASAKDRNLHNTRELQGIHIGRNEAVALDGCARLGNAFQLPGAAPTAQTVFMVGARQQLIAPILVRDKKFGSIEPALRDMDAAGKFEAQVLYVDDMSAGGTASWHKNGAKFIETVKSLTFVGQDAMHQCARVTQTLNQYHAERSAACRRLGQVYRYVAPAEYDKMKTYCTTPAGTPGGLKLGYTQKVDGVSTPVVFLRVSRDKRLALKHGEYMKSADFDDFFGGSRSPNRQFEETFAGNIVYTSHSADSIRCNLVDEYHKCAGRLVSCGQCATCNPAGTAATAAVAGAAARAASRTTAPLPAPSEIDDFAAVPAPTPVGQCEKPRREGNVDGKHRVLTSCDSKDAFARAHGNAAACVFPAHIIPRTLLKRCADGSAKLDLRGLEEHQTQQGTQYVESLHARFERALAAGGGFSLDNGTNLALDVATYVNAKARQDLEGEPNLGHSKLFIVDKINANYVAARKEKFYKWRCAPDPDDGRRYFGDYDKQQHPALYASMVAKGTVEQPTRPYRAPLVQPPPAQPQPLAAAQRGAPLPVASVQRGALPPPPAAHYEAQQGLVPQLELAALQRGPLPPASAVERPPPTPPPATAQYEAQHGLASQTEPPTAQRGVLQRWAPPLAAQRRAPHQALLSAASFYRESAGGPMLALPAEAAMLARDLNHNPYLCPCTMYKTTTGGWKRPRNHRQDCLHGIAMHLQRSKEARGVKKQKLQQ
ncbi:hypothetical protein M885DRAFT_575909, partial [Pelagophyceae sp. CCMP2097]